MKSLKSWQNHVITIKGEEVISQALAGQLKVEVPSVYIAYIPEIEDKTLEEIPTFLRTVTTLPMSHKITDIINKTAYQNKALITVQFDNIGLTDKFEYNAIIIMIKDNLGQIIPYSISVKKISEELPPESQPTQVQFELLTLLSSTTDVHLTINPQLAANRVQFDNTGTGLTATNTQDAIRKVNTNFTNHENNNILNTNGVHGLKYDKTLNQFSYFESSSWVVINLGESQLGGFNTELESEKQKLETLTNTVNEEKRKLETLTTKVSSEETKLNTLTNTVNEEKRKLETLTTTVDEEKRKLETLTTTFNQEKQKIEQNTTRITDHENKKINNEQGVHGLRYFENKLQVNTTGGWNIDLGPQVTPKNITDIEVQTEDQSLIIKWTDPTDLEIDGAIISRWRGTKVVYKTGDYPTTPEDGTLAINSTTRNQYQSNGLRIGNLTNDTAYYISFFPYSDTGAININEQNRITGTPSGRPKVPPNPVTGASIKVGNTQLTIKWTDPTDKADATWSKTKVVYKEGSYPANDRDGTLAVESTTRDQYKTNGYNLTGLTNGTEYYFTFFTYSVEGGINKDVQIKKTPQAYRVMTVRINQDNSNPEQCCTYEDDAINMTPGSPEWDDFFGHFPCLFKAGEIVGRLNPKKRTLFEDGRTADISSGREGDVMIAVPRNKSKMVTIGNEVLVSVTDDLSKGDGFDDLAHRRSNDPKDYFFIGAYQGSVIDGKLRSLAGQFPRTNISLSSARRLAQANGPGYDQLMFYPLNYLQSMYVLKYKNLDSQSVIGKGYIEYRDIPQTGGTEANGMDWGEQNFEQYIVLFGIEDFWGRLGTWVDGCYIDTNYNILTTTNNFNDNGTGYTPKGYHGSGRTFGFVQKIHGTTLKGFLPMKFYGSATTYYTDGGDRHPERSYVHGGFYGGDYTNTGIFHLQSLEPSDNHNFKGARLMYL